MNDTSSYAIISLVDKMERGKITRKKSEEEIQRIEREYADPFLPATFKKRVKPWDKAYLEELSGSVMFGKSSKAYLLHIAEVSEAVYRPARIMKATIIAAISIGVIIVALINLTKR